MIGANWSGYNNLRLIQGTLYLQDSFAASMAIYSWLHQGKGQWNSGSNTICFPWEWIPLGGAGGITLTSLCHLGRPSPMTALWLPAFQPHCSELLLLSKVSVYLVKKKMIQIWQHIHHYSSLKWCLKSQENKVFIVSTLAVIVNKLLTHDIYFLPAVLAAFHHSPSKHFPKHFLFKLSRLHPQLLNWLFLHFKRG